MDQFESNMGFSRKHMPAVRAALAQEIFIDATSEQDTKQATDLVLLGPANATVGVRIRSPKYLEKYPNDITFRLSTPSGAKVEFEKMMSGWCKWFFYGFSDGSDGLSAYYLLDMDLFRCQYHSGKIHVFSDHKNADGVIFRAFDVLSLPTVVFCARRKNKENKKFKEPTTDSPIQTRLF